MNKLERNTQIVETIKKSAEYRKAMSIVRGTRLVKDRIAFLSPEFSHEVRPMGSGGVGNIRILRDGTIYVQISAGKGRHNYATVVHIGRLPYHTVLSVN